MDDRIFSYAESLSARADAANVPSGILYWPLSNPYRIESFDGDEWRGECDQDLWRRLYSELHYGVKRDGGMLSLAQLDERLGEWHERGEVPVAIAYYGYDTPKRTFVGAVLAAGRKNEPFPQPDSAQQILEGKRAFFAGALLPVRSDVFDLLPFQHPGPEVHFVFPRSLFLTNLEAEPSGLEVDFADGLGFRDVAFGDRVTITYADEEQKQLRLRLDLNGRRLGASFELRFQPGWENVKPDLEWTFKHRDIRPYRAANGDVHGAGWAWVFLRKGATDGKIVNPMIFADGFGYQSSSLKELWEAANRAGLATRLREEGKDLILVGYWHRGTHIQANAMVVVAVIEKILKERIGQKPLVVLGASMGGLVTRYALLWMENQNPPIPHQVSTYLSYDTPHDGAWIPLILQKYIHWYRNRDEGELGPRAEMMLSPAAQQMLWAWTNHGEPDAKDHDYTRNPLRATFLSELAAMKQWPKVDKFAVANGRGDSVPEHNPGTLAVEWRAGCAGAYLHLQPEPGEDELIGGFHAGLERRRYHVSNVPAFDGAPGGLRDSFRELAEGLRRRGDPVKDPVKNSCFVPTVSALGLKLMSEPFTPIDGVRDKVPFKAFMYSDWTGGNTGHTEVREAMREFVLKHCAPRSDD